eukprot:582623-Alexandrium_andersonii.AAC.1
MNWARERFDRMIESRQHTQSYSEAEGVNGEYHPFSVILQKEGGGKEGLIAAKNLVQACYKLHAKGLTHNGKPYVVKNAFTKRPEYLYAKRVFSESFEQRWQKNFEE